MKPPFPAVWDSTIRAAWVKCEQFYNYAYLQNLRKPGAGIHLHFGACLAKGLEVSRRTFFEDKDNEKTALLFGAEAIIEAWGDPFVIEQHDKKNIGNCLLAHESYFHEYPLPSDHVQPHKIGDKYGIEVNFGVPIPGTRHPVSGEPIVYAGRFDLLADFNDAVFVVDEKTSGSLGASWRNNWRLRSQFTGYCWGAGQYGIPVQGAIIRGIGILKNSITFEQVIVARPQWMIDRWLDQIRLDIERAIIAWQAGKYSLNLDNACTEYGGCPYLELCESQYPERWLGNYETSKWEPLKVAAE